VFAEPVQEDDGCAWVFGRPVAVVGPTLRMIDERHKPEFSCDPLHKAMANDACEGVARVPGSRFLPTADQLLPTELNM
jgi:hypothetical protein